MSDARRIELQVGHLCNNRCVFCISGHLTHLKQAPLLPVSLLRARIDKAHAAGQRHLTFLGGEPTIQPGFVELVEHAAKLGFERIVVFSNGTRMHRPELLEALLATGAAFEFRFSFQGGNTEAHERTTRRKGSFGQLVASLQAVRARGQLATVNMCVVRQNFESVVDLPALLLPHGVAQLHLDMIHPDDTPGIHGAALAEIMPDYSQVASSLRAMATQFPTDFDLNIGNLPHCFAPELARHIHHGGQVTETSTAAISGEPELNAAWNKYEHKQKNKLKLPSCASCVFNLRCTGVFTQYAELHGTEALLPVSPARLRELDPERSDFVANVSAALGQISGVELSSPGELPEFLPRGTECVEARFGATRCYVTRHNGQHARAEACSISVAPGAEFADVERCWATLRAWFGGAETAPLGRDCVDPIAPRLNRVLNRLRRDPPAHPLRWVATTLVGEQRVELSLAVEGGGQVQLWFATQGAQLRGYRVVSEINSQHTEHLKRALRAVFDSSVASETPPVELARPS